MGKFTAIPENTFKELQLDAGVILKNFDPTGAKPMTNADIICATTGGINPSCVPTFSDMGEDVDNCPVNMMELKKLESWECKLAFTALSITADTLKLALGAADVTGNKTVTPRASLKTEDFTDIWWVGGRADGGHVAIQLKNVLSTGGLSLQSTKNGKGQLSVELTGHYSIKAQDTVPMVFYVEDGDQ